MLGSLLKQMVSRTGRIPEKIWRELREQREAVSGRRPQLADIVKMLQLITSSQRTFMVIDALDECTALQRFRLFDSLDNKSLGSPLTPEYSSPEGPIFGLRLRGALLDKWKVYL